MPLAPIPTVPHAVGAEVPGLDGTRVWLDLPDPCDRLTLWAAIGGDMGSVQLDLMGVQALRGLLMDVEDAMLQAARDLPE